ncbi:hypothetical protein PQJ75_26100 [Rhodoplanes sp. TEM]|uniref:Uncharacterized protein n=1 Tax=Rhodoplanes tepidamans TaxID=200616 RepID=A0ABT5JGW6_RHOTP|nr:MULTISPECIES: hypothetical protein [Rhodoplanes]MDC7788968.1 hypothetical protein [Rhodoplanes tepidamans]MDC7987221.1 hypothetical protein [Rhodoplanes sp. TEM]MDQ0358662.1 hypothetical protein [Rhodoplanes tepidamans]
MTQEMLGGLLLQLYGSFLVSAVVAALTAVVTVRLMTRRQADAPAVPAVAHAPAVPAPAPAGPILGPGVGADDLAVIAAIAAAAFGAHRVVYIGEARPGSGWTSQIRTRHHASHAPHKANHH